MNYPLAGLVVDSLTLIALIVSVVLLYRQISKEHEWNRRKTSQDLLMSLVTGDFTNLRHDLEVGFGVRLDDVNQTYADVRTALPPDRQAALKFSVDKLLNFYETIAIGIKNNVLDEEVCFDHFSWNLTRYWKWAEPYHVDRRGLDSTIWMEAAHYVDEWDGRLRDERAVLRKQGKAKL